MASIQKIINVPGRGTGKYRYRVMWREDGRQRSRTFNNRLDAKTEALAVEKGEHVVYGDHTFWELAKQFLSDNNSEVKASTLAFYKQTLDNHLLPAWKNKKLGKLRKMHVIELKTALQEQQKNANTIVNVLTVATVVLNHGIELEWLQTNVASQTKKPKRVKRPIRLLNDAEQCALIKATDSDYRMLILLALRSGLRKGELLGLQWQSVNVDKGAIEVCEQFTHGAISTPKTDAGRRIVPIDPDTAGQLKRWRAVARRPKDGLDLVFPSSTGRHQSASNVRHRQWKPALSRAELPSTIRFHDLRHTYASMVISAGVPLNDLKVVLGHSSIAVTADVYGHLLENSHDRLRTVFAASSMPDAVDQPIAAINR